MIRLLLLLVLLFPTITTRIRFGSNLLDTRDAFKSAMEGSAGGRSSPRTCFNAEYRDSTVTGKDCVKNPFLSLVDFMEYVQMSELPESSYSDVFAYYNVSLAAIDAGNYITAHQSMARAFEVIENVRRVERDKFGFEKRSSSISKRVTTQTLLDQLKRERGEKGYLRFLNIEKVTSIFILIDTSLSMKNDFAAVRYFVSQIVAQQKTTNRNVRYVVGTFAERVDRPRIYTRNTKEMLRDIDNLVARAGGDCHEKTCAGLAGLIPYGFQSSNQVIYVFTDGSSKDCTTTAPTLAEVFQAFKTTVNFVLFGSCEEKVDLSFLKLAEDTNGFCLLITDTNVLNITDVVNGAFETDSVICIGDSTIISPNGHGQGYTYRKRSVEALIPLGGAGIPSSYATGTPEMHIELIPIDELMSGIKLVLTISPSHLGRYVRFEKPLDGFERYCTATRISRSTDSTGNLVFDVFSDDCTCTGDWRLMLPQGSTYKYTAKSIGETTLGLETYFVDNAAKERQVSSFSPCVGVPEDLVIKIHQVEHVVRDSLVVELVSGDGTVFHSEPLKALDWYPEFFTLTVVLPESTAATGFRVVLRGRVDKGSEFRRTSRYHFRPTTSCLRVMEVNNYYSLFPSRGRTYMKMRINNFNAFPERYIVFCENSLNYPLVVVAPSVTVDGRRLGRSNPFVLLQGEAAEFMVSIVPSSRSSLERGRVVLVSCEVITTTNDNLRETVMLTELLESPNSV